MELIDIKELMETFSKSEINDFELELEGIKIKMAKRISEQPEFSYPTDTQIVSRRMIPEKVSAVETSTVSSELVDEHAGSNVIEIVSPMVGTFYRAPSPTSDPYVVEGDLIKEGQDLCIIEAMKLMNEIESEYTGKIVRILVENGQPVEYGEPLFLLELVE